MSFVSSSPSWGLHPMTPWKSIISRSPHSQHHPTGGWASTYGFTGTQTFRPEQRTKEEAVGGEPKPLRREATDLGNDRLRQRILTREGCWGEPALIIGVEARQEWSFVPLIRGPPELARWEMREDRRAASCSWEGCRDCRPSLAP